MSGTHLELGAQSRAAVIVEQSMEPVDAALRDLAATVESQADGFRGAAAAAVSEALQAWFDAASDLLPAMAGLASRLVQTDVTAARSDAAQSESYARLAARLDGGVSLDGSPQLNGPPDVDGAP